MDVSLVLSWFSDSASTSLTLNMFTTSVCTLFKALLALLYRMRSRHDATKVRSGIPVERGGVGGGGGGISFSGVNSSVTSVGGGEELVVPLELFLLLPFSLFKIIY